MLRICTFASGSSGNCTFVSDGQTHILIDVGISCRRIEQSLRFVGCSLADISGILVTHAHQDHIGGLRTMLKKCPAPIYSTSATYQSIYTRIHGDMRAFHKINPGEVFCIGNLLIEAFPTSHDISGSVGFSVWNASAKMSLCTDLGYVSDAVLAGIGRTDLLIAETNHDLAMLQDGPYPQELKQRIRSNHGHLSNEDGAAMILACVQKGCRQVILAHLSDKNNSPELALSTVCTCLSRAGFDPEAIVSVSLAPRNDPGPVFEIGKDKCPC